MLHLCLTGFYLRKPVQSALPADGHWPTRHLLSNYPFIQHLVPSLKGLWGQAHTYNPIIIQSRFTCVAFGGFEAGLFGSLTRSDSESRSLIPCNFPCKRTFLFNQQSRFFTWKIHLNLISKSLPSRFEVLRLVPSLCNVKGENLGWHNLCKNSKCGHSRLFSAKILMCFDRYVGGSD